MELLIGGRSRAKARVLANELGAEACEIDIDGDLLEQGGIDALGWALDEVVRTVQAACARHDVTFLETDIGANGLKILLAAGAPTTSGDNEGRMLAAVRTILDGRPAPASAHRREPRPCVHG